MLATCWPKLKWPSCAAPLQRPSRKTSIEVYQRNSKSVGDQDRCWCAGSATHARANAVGRCRLGTATLSMTARAQRRRRPGPTPATRRRRPISASTTIVTEETSACTEEITASASEAHVVDQPCVRQNAERDGDEADREHHDDGRRPAASPTSAAIGPASAASSRAEPTPIASNRLNTERRSSRDCRMTAAPAPRACRLRTSARRSRTPPWRWRTRRPHAHPGFAARTPCPAMTRPARDTFASVCARKPALNFW